MTSSAVPDSEIVSPRQRVFEEPIQKLPGFIATAVDIASARPGGEVARDALAASVEAQCIGCGIAVSGAELLALHAETCGESARVARLRLGYCARNTCESLFYSVRAKEHPLIDWEQIFAIKEGLVAPPSEPVVDSRRWWERVSPRTWWCIGGGAAILLLLLAWRMYAGGRIPLLREPEKWQVDVIPNYGQ